jgi:hypothetical protein
LKRTIFVLRETQKGQEKLIAYVDILESRLKEKLQRYKDMYPKDIIRFAMEYTIDDLTIARAELEPFSYEEKQN